MKKVGRKTWERAVYRIESGMEKYPYTETLAILGISRATFFNRLNQYRHPEIYGEIPDYFFEDSLEMSQRHDRNDIAALPSTELPYLGRKKYGN